MLKPNNSDYFYSPSVQMIGNETDTALSETNPMSAIPLAFLIVFTIFGNLLVCAAFYLCRDLRTVTNYFVISLAVADLLVGFVCMPFWFSYLLVRRPNEQQDNVLYKLWIFLDIVSGTSSIMNLVAISIDRFYAITSPFNYHLKLTRKRALFCIVVVWLYSVIVGTLWISKRVHWYVYFVACASFFVPLPILVYSYARIFRVAHKQALKMQGDCYHQTAYDGTEVSNDSGKNVGAGCDQDVLVHVKPRTSTSSRYSYSVAPRNSSSASRGGFDKVRPRLTSQNSVRHMRRVLQADLKAAKTLAVVMGAFIACWSPFIITMLVVVSCANCVPREVASIMKWLHYSNSAVNPIIYTVLNRHFRAAFRRILCRFVSGRRFSYVGHLLSFSTSRSSSRSSGGHTMGELSKAHFKTEVELLVCTEVVTVV